jgi:hypothetical protein
MSGFEIAGLVLGAFPIAIEALKQYHTVARTFGFWWEIRLEYLKCSGDLKYQKLRFTRNLELLILPLITEDAHIKSLIADPAGSKWKEPDIAQQLEDRLRDSYDLYFDIVQALQRTMGEFNEELGVDRASVQEKLTRSKVMCLLSNLDVEFVRPNSITESNHICEIKAHSEKSLFQTKH